MEYRALGSSELTRGLFSGFDRRQEVTLCRRRVDGAFRTVIDSFTDNWDEADFTRLLAALRETADGGGLVAGAFCGGALKGFCAVSGVLIGGERRYADLLELHVSREARRQGVGRALFAMAKDFARALGARKLYLSAHSAIETQAFYRAMGCRDAGWYSSAHIAKEPCDCQLECSL